jgi:cytidyltransferase-like protein
MCPSNIFTWSGMKYCFDLDGTICDTPMRPDDNKPGYLEANPFPFMVEQVNRLYDEGHKIIIQTARGRGSGIDWTGLTKEQLRHWGVKYHDLEPMFHKPTADIFIDDKGINVEAWKKTVPPKKGIIAGAFDVIHPGYIRMFKEAKEHCNHLTVALHEDPSMARPHKLKPVQTVEERREILLAIEYVDDVVVYQAEDTFLYYLDDYEIRFLGTDYMDGSYTGKDNPIDIVWLDREGHDYSSTKLKTQIFESVHQAMTMEVDYD